MSEHVELVREALKFCGLEFGSIEAVTDRVEVEPLHGMYAETTWGYSGIAMLANELGTTDINFHWKRGWGGGDMTPGDPDNFYVSIGF